MKAFLKNSLPSWRIADFLAVDFHFDAKGICVNRRPGSERENEP